MHVHTCTLVRKGKVEGVCYPYCVVCSFCGWDWEIDVGRLFRTSSLYGLRVRNRKSWGATSFHFCGHARIAHDSCSEDREEMSTGSNESELRVHAAKII